MKSQATLHVLTLLFTLLLMPSVFAEGIRLGTNTIVSFASVEAGRKILTNRDDFVAALSPFDRAARMKTDREATEKDYLEFVGRNVLPWLPEETNKIAGVLQTLGTKLAAWNLPFPSTILLIKTSGREEGNASYTRQNAVIFCEHDLRSAETKLTDLIVHELFHVLSRQNPALRRQLYHLIGFNPLGAVDFPEELRPCKITNPDGVQYSWFINITNRGRTLPVIPILYASPPHYVPDRGGEFFEYLTFKFLVVTNGGIRWTPRLVNGHPQLLEPGEVEGFFEQVGNNTQYVIHPDEILADNFVQLINEMTNLPTPRIIAGMKKVLMERENKTR